MGSSQQLRVREERILRLAMCVVAVVMMAGVLFSMQASKLDVSDANYHLEKLERYVQGLNGKEGTLDSDGKIALRKVSDLRTRFPDDGNVIVLFERARAAATLLKGDRIEVTPELLAYRDLEKEKVGLFADANRAAWKEFESQLLEQDDGVLFKPFPALNPEKTSIEDVKGWRVVLSGFRYPEDVFLHYGQPFVSVGSPAIGHYFVDASNRSFIGAYEAVRRYQRNVSSDIPIEWTVIATIESPGVMVPGGGDSQAAQAFPGWVLSVEAIWVPETLFAIADDEHPLGGFYVGEDRAAELMADFYSIKSIPKDVVPDELLQILSTAIKEKNFDLFRCCIHPSEQETALQREWLERTWDMFQRRYRNDIVHVDVLRADSIDVLQGGGSSAEEELLGEFLEEGAVAELLDDGLPRSEKQTLWLKLYDETGRIREYAKPLTFRRDEDVEGFRWFVYSGWPY